MLGLNFCHSYSNLLIIGRYDKIINSVKLKTRLGHVALQLHGDCCQRINFINLLFWRRNVFNNIIGRIGVGVASAPSCTPVAPPLTAGGKPAKLQDYP